MRGCGRWVGDTSDRSGVSVSVLRGMENIPTEKGKRIPAGGGIIFPPAGNAFIYGLFFELVN